MEKLKKKLSAISYQQNETLGMLFSPEEASEGSTPSGLADSR